MCTVPTILTRFKPFFLIEAYVEQCRETHNSVYSCVRHHYKSHYSSFFPFFLSAFCHSLLSSLNYISFTHSFHVSLYSFILFCYYIISFINSILFVLSFFSFLSIYSFFLYLNSPSFLPPILPFFPFNFYHFVRYRSRFTYILKQDSIQRN